MKKILTFDVGTTSMKCSVFDEDFHTVASSSAEYTLMTGDGRIEADPELYWTGLCRSIRAVWEAGIEPGEIEAVAITTQGETLIALDDQDLPVLPAIVWLDERAGLQAKQLSSKIRSDTFYRTTGLPSITAAMPIAKLKWLMEQDSLKDRISRIFLLEDYLIYRLSGVFATEQSLVCSTGYYNIMEHRYEAPFLALTGVKEGMLPEVFPCGTVVGTVSGQAAARTGLPVGCKIICTAMDQTAGAVGAGNIAPGTVSETTGTCLTVAATTEMPDFEAGSGLQFYTHYDGRYLALAYNPTAAIVMKWFKDNFVCDTEGCIESGENPYQYMSQLAASVPVGCDGLMLLPHFSGKLMPEKAEAERGVFVGIHLGTTRAHFIRAIMEGVSFMLKENLDLLKDAHIDVAQILSLGGGSRDTLWCQIKADVLGFPVMTAQNEESASLGAAILAAKALDPTVSVPALCQKAVKIKERYLPIPANTEQYRKLFGKYRRLDQSAAAFFAET